MPSKILTTGLTEATFKSILFRSLRQAKPTVLGVAVAYVSVPGFKYIDSLVNKFGIKQFKLVADTKDGVTHPAALGSALAKGWHVRVVDNLPGTFHPKLYVGGAAFTDEAGILDTSLILTGSANLSAAALSRNGECSYLHIGTNLAKSAGKAWRDCWEAGCPLTASKLSDYEHYFAARNRNRRPVDLITLGVADGEISLEDGSPPKNVSPPPNEQKALSNTVATTSWAGLQSFTGDYDLQVEFPKDAGTVLSRLLGLATGGHAASLLCEDGIARQFVFKYYQHNGMFRLNVPNSTPNVDWARKHKNGIAVVEVDDEDGVIKFRVVRPGPKLFEVVARSLGLGTWGRTPTRLYGWY
jgi:HKD family nuclease